MSTIWAPFTKTNTIWRIIRKISRKPQPATLKHLTKKNSSLKNSNPQFISYKSKSEKQKLNFKTINSEKYNLPFTPAELKEAIQISQIQKKFETS